MALWKVRGASASGHISARTAALASSWTLGSNVAAVTPASASQASWKLANSKVVVTFSLVALSPASAAEKGSQTGRLALQGRRLGRVASAQSCSPSAEILRCRLPQVRPKPRPSALHPAACAIPIMERFEVFFYTQGLTSTPERQQASRGLLIFVNVFIARPGML